MDEFAARFAGEHVASADLVNSAAELFVRFIVKREMDRQEELTEAYLKALGFKDVVFEPEGKSKLPDFQIDGNIAVEVRRLNQHYFTKDKVRGLEEGRIPLFQLIESSLSQFDSQYKGRSYWISIRFHRPIGKSNTNKKAIIKALTDFLSKPFSLPCDVKATDSISFRVWASQAMEGKVFRFAGGTDREGGGWVLAEFKKNFNHCVKAKRKRSRTTMTNTLHGGLFWWTKLLMALMTMKKTK